MDAPVHQKSALQILLWWPCLCRRRVVLLRNERSRRVEGEMDGGEGRLAELQEENARLLQSEDEQVMLILDMEAQLERLISEIERIKSSSE